jgi:DNA polymerase epsilon subunit 2
VLRLTMVEQRVRRHHMFKPPVLANGIAPREHLELTGLDALIGRSGVRVVLGVLVELDDGAFALEDAHASIPLDLSAAETTDGLFTRHAVVLAEGEVLPTGVFRVRQLGLPPAESIDTSLASLGSFDALRAAAPSPTSVTAASAAEPSAASRAGSNSRAAALATQNAMLVVLSDVWLDSPTVRDRLAAVFAGYEQVGAQMVGSGRAAVPLATFFAFVLCGNFASSGLASGAAPAHGAALTTNFRALAALLQAAPTLAKHAHFVLMPGPDDPSVGAADVLPRAPLPAALCGDVLRAANNVHLGSSPCRLVLCGQHVCIQRDETLVKARRACVVPPRTDTGAPLHHHLIKSLVDGAHLSPLPQTEAAVYWQYDHALWLHPAPDVLVLADRQAQYTHSYEGTLAFNPGAFASDLSWMVYRPATKEAEASCLEP